jgi:hypothetical protein
MSDTTVPTGPRHVSIDLETLGIKPTALILSIGAVAFDPKTGEQTDDGFYRIVDIAHAIGGGDIDPSTVNWWMKQSQAARDEIFGDVNAEQRVNLRVALSELSDYLGFSEAIPEGEFPDLVLWARGSKDEQWLDSAYKGMQLAPPFAYWQWKDERTFTGYFKQFLPDRGELVAHNAFDDALYQSLCVSAVFRRLAAIGHNVGWKKAEKITTVVNSENEGSEVEPWVGHAAPAYIAPPPADVSDWEDSHKVDPENDHPNTAHS